jgi:hypothetical protein
MTTKAKLTKAQKARARRAVVGDFEVFATAGNIRAAGMHELKPIRPWDPEWPEVERLLKLALKAVRDS